VQSLYPIANAVLFGSNAIGLSLPNSDVDILLCGLPCSLKEDASDFLAQIAVDINAMGWVVSCSTYLSAKVPIIKLEIDPSIPFLQTKRRQDLFRVYNPMALYYLDTNKCPAGRTIKVDITINVPGVTSVGYESTVLMKDWITRMPEIQRILILFKYILAIRNFNSNFNGGIGSYCLFAMIAAFLKNNPSPSDGDLSSIFIHILKWYGEDFDNLTYVVWLR
jgi:DNA polymerase sigma